MNRKKTIIILSVSILFLAAVAVLVYYRQDLFAGADTFVGSQKKLLIDEMPNEEMEAEVIGISSLADFTNSLIQGEKSKVLVSISKIEKTSEGLGDYSDSSVLSPSGEGFSVRYTEGVYIHIDISSQTLYLVEDGTVIGKYLVSTGTYSMPTPLGTYHINTKKRLAYTARYGLYMPYWMAFIGSSYGIHELPYGSRGREGSSHLGMRVSHGCVRLGVGPAAYVYSKTPIGAPVVIVN